MSIDINIHISADDAFTQALSDIAGSLAAVSIAKTGNTQVTLPVQEEKSAKKQESATLVGKPATPKEEKAINDILSTPAPSDPKPKEEDTAKREKMKALFTKAATEGKQAACKALLKELGVTRQSQIPADKLDEAIAKVEAL